MKIAEKMCVLGEKIAAVDDVVTGRNVHNCGIVPNAEPDFRGWNTAADAVDKRAFTDVANPHRLQSSSRRPDARAFGFVQAWTFDFADLASQQCRLEDAFDIVNEDEFHVFPNVFADIFEIAAVQRGEDNGIDFCTMRRQYLLFDSADRQHFAAKRDFTGHCDFPMDRLTGE